MRTKASGESSLLLLDAVEVLRAEKVDYAVIGALAASVHGLVRASLDADDSISAVLALYDEFENRVDLLVGIRGFDPSAFSRTIEVPFAGETLRFVGLEDFIAMKIFAGSPQDVADARNALKVSSEPPDLTLLQTLVKRYGITTARSLESLLSEVRKD